MRTQTNAYRVASKATLQVLSESVGLAVWEAILIPPSRYRYWTVDGQCFEAMRRRGVVARLAARVTGHISVTRVKREPAHDRTTQKPPHA